MSWETWSFAFNVTMPNLLMLLMGMALRKIGMLNDAFCDSAMRLVFNLSLPCLLFFSVATNHQSIIEQLPLVIYGVIGTLATFLLLEVAAIRLVKEPTERGVFVQGGFRSNTGIMGLAFAMSAYGEEGVAVGSLYLIVTVIMFNALSVITLTRSLHNKSHGQGISKRELLMSIATNPLIIGLLSGLLYSQSRLPMPGVIHQTGSFIASLALPLALLCAGASLDWRSMFRSSNVALLSSTAKLLIVPAILTLGGWLVGFRGVTLGVIFLFSATPTAAGSYVMTRAMGGNATLAANIIGLTTAGSFFVIALGLYFLRSLGVI
ncbi:MULTISPECIES: AEC family transporter [unclassified Brenneria]|uniref:AEC family transporter n=1 Tax=unclassified Brenneria TaxID=2634434 RepID=UPI001554361A|nr:MULTISPECIES: AEC family transporter [unclassified Brenneria]MEE3645129.1 AEC family transporter [Brenneria sp. L3_3C_1]MEE3652772.1 AEC family transporter [Brenneria sp. HEZEL_4_2_4]MBJ7223884.1 AEC family transporter [Brenneria sp. L3-3C-1]MEE3652813.1 AEC family transporter [Brenneria sp. HEZEL_4_2_4]NPD02728.1 AEC family transporter [Brenneria sp. hezel4-2-4]